MDSNDLIGSRINAILDDEIVNSRVERQADLQGAFSSGGGYCPEGIPVETAIFAALAAFGVAFGILYRAVTVTTGGRKKRDTSSDDKPISLMDEIGDHVADLFWWGMKFLIDFHFWEQVYKTARQDTGPFFSKVIYNFKQNFVFLLTGLEEFEDKVNKIAIGEDNNSWIGQIYEQFSSNFDIDGSKLDDDDIGDKEG